MERGFKYRIYPNESQRDQIARTFGCCRFVYNRALDVKKTAYSETGKSIATSRNMSASLRGSSVGSPAGKVHARARNRAAGI